MATYRISEIVEAMNTSEVPGNLNQGITQTGELDEVSYSLCAETGAAVTAIAQAATKGLEDAAKNTSAMIDQTLTSATAGLGQKIAGSLGTDRAILEMTSDISAALNPAAAFTKVADEKYGELLGIANLAINSSFVQLAHDLETRTNGLDALAWLETSHLSLANSMPTPISAGSYPVCYDDDPEPAGGELCRIVCITNGNSYQVGSVLNDEFEPRNSLACYLIPHGDTNYWHIAIYSGDEDEPCLLVETMERDNRALLKWHENTVRIGYIHISDRPLMPIKFYVYSQSQKELVLSFVDKVARELLKWGFEIEGWATAEESPYDDMPSGGEEIVDFHTFDIMNSVEGLEVWIKSYLRSMGRVAESMSVQLTHRTSGEMRIQYTLDGCLILIHTETIKPIQIRIRPSVISWIENQREQAETILRVREHVERMLGTLKENVRWVPIKPADLEDHHAWFVYYHECQEAGIKYNLKDLAKDIHLAHGYVRQLHMGYKAEFKT